MLTTGSDVKKWREALGMSEQALAERLPVPLKTLQGWEQGRGAPPAYIGRALSDLERELCGSPIVIKPLTASSPWSDPNPPDFPEPGMVKMHVPYHGERRQVPEEGDAEDGNAANTHELAYVQGDEAP